MERDEIWTFVGRKKRKVWLWLTVERASQRIVAWVLGSRGTCAALAGAAPPLPPPYALLYRCLACLPAGYCPPLLTAAHRVGKTVTRVVEALNGKLRHRCGVLMRRSRSFSKCRTSHYNRIKIAINQYNLEITLN